VTLAHHRIAAIAACLLTVALAATPALGLLPVTGKPIPELQAIDDAMQTYCQQYSPTGGVLAISRNGSVIYQRGFGYKHGSPNPEFLYENTPMRIASVEKPLTGAAIRHLIASGVGGVDLNDHIFDFGQPGGGLLNYVPWNGLGSLHLYNVTVEHCLQHTAGWDRALVDICSFPDHDPRPGWGDPMNDEICIAEKLGISSPPVRNDLIRYMLHQPLQHTPPGSEYAYSNFGYMLLGRVIEQHAATDPLTYIRQHILTSGRWVPRSEIFYGRTFAADQNVREPTYFDAATMPNVFDPAGPEVPRPYGGFAIENMVGHGNLVASAAPLVIYMNYYQVEQGYDIGTPLAGGTPHYGVHGGTLPGTGSFMCQRPDGINYVALFNDEAQHGEALIDLVNALIDGGTLTWPTLAVDGFWLDFGYVGSAPQFGAYNAPFRTIPTAISATQGDGVKLHFKPGTSNWTGTLNYKMRFDAPMGTVRIGV